MHDLMFSKEIIAAISNKAETLGKDEEVTSVNVRLSPLSHVKADTLNDTFSLMIKETPYSKVRLVIDRLGLDIRCRSCNNVFTVDEPTFECPKCLNKDIDIVHNKEFVVESVESGKANGR